MVKKEKEIEKKDYIDNEFVAIIAEEALGFNQEMIDSIMKWSAEDLKEHLEMNEEIQKAGYHMFDTLYRVARDLNPIKKYFEDEELLNIKSMLSSSNEDDVRVAAKILKERVGKKEKIKPIKEELKLYYEL
jgi:hypothetical protein